MKKHTKLLALTMALAIAVLSFSACGMVKDAEEVGGTVDAFMNELCSLGDGVDTYLTDDADLGDAKKLVEAAQSLSDELDPDKLFGEEAGDMFEDEVEKAKNDIKAVFSDALNYEITGIDVKGKKADVQVTITGPDTDFSDVEIDELDPSDFGFSNDELLAYLYDNYSMEELATMSEDEAMNISSNYIKDNNIMGKMLDYLIGVVEEELNNAEKTSEACTITLERVDGKWLVSKIE